MGLGVEGGWEGCVVWESFGNLFLREMEGGTVSLGASGDGEVGEGGAWEGMIGR